MSDQLWARSCFRPVSRPMRPNFSPDRNNIGCPFFLTSICKRSSANSCGFLPSAVCSVARGINACTVSRGAQGFFVFPQGPRLFIVNNRVHFHFRLFEAFRTYPMGEFSLGMLG